jgi:hypothetical protein
MNQSTQGKVDQAESMAGLSKMLLPGAGPHHALCVVTAPTALFARRCWGGCERPVSGFPDVGRRVFVFRHRRWSVGASSAARAAGEQTRPNCRIVRGRRPCPGHTRRAAGLRNMEGSNGCARRRHRTILGGEIRKLLAFLAMGRRVIKCHLHRHVLNHSYDRIYICEHVPMEVGA